MRTRPVQRRMVCQYRGTRGSAMESSRPGNFPSTVWSVVLRAGGTDSAAVRTALERLCTAYWYPLYSFVRQRGHPAADAEDLTQSFLADVLEKHAFDRVGPERGRFRTFLLASLKNFMANEWDRKNAAKRGGGQCFI